MEFKNSITISAILHVLVIVLVPGFKFAQIQTDWIEVSVVTFPNMKDMTPDWQPGKRAIPQPSKKIPEIDKSEFPFPVEESDIGIPVEREIPQLPESALKRDFEQIVEEKFEKIVPGRKDRKGIVEGLGEDSDLIISGPVSKRVIIRPVKPKYPAWAEEKGVEGEVELKFWVAPEGMVTSVELTRTSGYPDFDSRAMEALKKWLFSPLGKNEEQKAQWGTITIKYSLK